MDVECITTEFVLPHILIYSRRSLSSLNLPLNAVNSKEIDVLNRICLFSNRVFCDNNRNICRFTKKFHVTKRENFEPLMMSVYEQLFTDRISWYRIVLFLNIAIYSYWVNVSDYYLIAVMSRIARAKFQQWIDDHNGWESIHADESQAPFPRIDRTATGRLQRNKKLHHNAARRIKDI